MKITMIGDKSVGKTTFMMSTYGLMQDEKTTGFKLKCRNESAHERLIRAYNDFRSLGEYPPPTVQMSEYEYDFYDGDEWVMDFSLVDIRGESIHDYNVDELTEKLLQSHAMMLFLNGYDIINGKDVSEQLFDIKMLINNSFVTDNQSRLIMVVFSQCDRIPDFGDETIAQLTQTVQDLKDMAEKSNNISFCAVPTACSLDCMMDLDYAFVYLMHFGYLTDVLQRRKSIEEEIQRIRELWGSGFWDGLTDLLGINDERDEARIRYRVLEGQIAEHDKMVDKFNELKKFLDEYKLGKSYRIRKRYSSTWENPWNM